MVVPDFQSFMLPLLKFADDDKEHSQREAAEALAHYFNATEADRKELLPSGRQSKFNNRIAWAGVYLRKAGFLESIRRGRFKISERGRKILKSNPARIDNKFLMEYGNPEFREFHKPTRHAEGQEEICAETVRTPREVMESGYQGHLLAA